MSITLPQNYRPTDREPFMNAMQQEYFRQKLLKWKNELIEESNQTLQNMQEESLAQPDLADRATADRTRLSTLEQGYNSAVWAFDNGRATFASGDGRFSLAIRARFQAEIGRGLVERRAAPAVEGDVGQRCQHQLVGKLVTIGHDLVLRYLDGLAAQFLDIGQARRIGHPHGVEDAVEMVALVLHHAGMEAVRLALDWLSIQPHAAIAEMGVARHPAGQARHRQAALISFVHRGREGDQLGIDQHGQRHPLALGARGRNHEDHQAQRHRHLRRGEADAAHGAHGLLHVGDQRRDLGIGRVGHFEGTRFQQRVAHADDVENGHPFNMMADGRAVKAATEVFV
jgi:hypothetical protein